MKIYRIIDANINRASEGLRVLEDIARFNFNNKILCEKLKKLRHNIRKKCKNLFSQFLNARDSDFDIGYEISKELKLDNKTSIYELIIANFKRSQEAVRTIEESLKIIDNYYLSKVFEKYRFYLYSIEKEYFLFNSLVSKKQKLNFPLYCLTASEFSNGKDNIEIVKEMLDSGVKIIQYREKEMSYLKKYNECVKIRELTEKDNATFIINDNIDLAMIIKADGVHIGQDDLPLKEVRQLVGNDFIIGLSTHSPMQANEAVLNGADYIGVGPIFKTFTKKNVCEPVGLDYLNFVAQNINIPFVAIGGIKENNLKEVLEKGASCVALVTEIVGSDDISSKIKNIINIIGTMK